MPNCPRCKAGLYPGVNHCSLCGYGTDPHPVYQPPPPVLEKPKIHKPYTQIGQTIVNDKWGKNNDSTIRETILGNTPADNTLAIMAAILQELQETRVELSKSIDRLGRVIEKAPAKAEIALEKERQKTADKQKKANEALPSPVVVVQCPNEVLDRIPLRRLRGRW